MASAAAAKRVALSPRSSKAGLAPRDTWHPVQRAAGSSALQMASQQQRTRGAAGRRRVHRCNVLASLESAAGSAAPPNEPLTQQQRRVVVAVDASEDSIAAFNWVLNNLLKPTDELHLLHVVPDMFFSPSSGSIYYCSSPDPEAERLLWQQAKDYFVDNFLDHAKANGLEDSVWLHLIKERRHKHIGKAVCQKAEELGADPLVVACHDKGPLEELLLGSVSKFCAMHSKRPVLLLHPNHSRL